MERVFIVWLICLSCTVLTFEIVCKVLPFLSSYYYLLARNVFGLIIGHWLFVFSRDSVFKKRINPNKKAVFVTGCDSGFGFQLAKRLDSKGYHVFAGCLFPTSGGAAELKNSCSSRFCAIHIDVTQDDSVQNAKEFVEKHLRDCELWAVVNNAGVYKGLSVEFTPISDFEDILQVNTLGQVRVTKAFLPLIRQSKGRIINVNSIVGRIAFPLMPGYTMSKFAAVAFTECLRREVDLYGVKVISIEPDLFKTPMNNSENLSKQLEKTRASMENEFKSGYGKKLIKRMKLLHTYVDKIASPNTQHVVNAMEAAVSLQHPCPAYVPCGNKLRHIFIYFIGCLPDFFLDFIWKIYNKAAPVLEPMLSAFL